jgi:hypothetical protein
MTFKKGKIPKGAKPFNKYPENINKEGRPKKLPELDKLLIEVLADEHSGKTAAEAILMALRHKAIKGDIRAAEVLLDRAYGKSIEKFEHRIVNGVEIIFTDDDINEGD